MLQAELKGRLLQFLDFLLLPLALLYPAPLHSLTKMLLLAQPARRFMYLQLQGQF